MKKTLFLTMLFCFTLTGTAHAVPITNGSFESGLTGWTSAGNVNVVNSQIVTDGSFFSTTTMMPTDGNNFAAISADLPSSSLTSDGFSVEIGDEISFDWFFSAEDYFPFNDLAGYSINLISAGAVVDANILSSVVSVGDYGLTGWNTASILSPVAGNVSLQFYSVNTGDGLLASVLGVDNVSSVSSVPVVPSLALFGIGALAFAGTRRRKNSKLII